MSTIPTIVLPAISEVVNVEDLSAITDDEDIAYNAFCLEKILTELKAQRAAGVETPTAKTHYPYDAPDGSSDDTVALGRDDEIVVLDLGEE